MYKRLFALFMATLFSSASFGAFEVEVEGTSKYIVEARTVVIEGQSAIDLYTALDDNTIEYPGNKTGIKHKNNVRCVAEILTARDEGEFVGDARCMIKLSKSTAINE